MYFLSECFRFSGIPALDQQCALSKWLKSKVTKNIICIVTLFKIRSQAFQVTKLWGFCLVLLLTYFHRNNGRAAVQHLHGSERPSGMYVLTVLVVVVLSHSKRKQLHLHRHNTTGHDVDQRRMAWTDNRGKLAWKWDESSLDTPWPGWFSVGPIVGLTDHSANPKRLLFCQLLLPLPAHFLSEKSPRDRRWPQEQ